MKKRTLLRRVPRTEVQTPAAQRRQNAWKPFGRATDANMESLTSVPANPPVLVLRQEGRRGAGGTGDAGGSGGRIGEVGAGGSAERMTSRALDELEAAFAREATRVEQLKRMEQSGGGGSKESGGGKGVGRGGDGGEGSPLSGAKAGVYRARGKEGATMHDNAEVTALRVSNLSEDTNEEALRLLCAKIGRVQRVYVPMVTERDPNTGVATQRNKGYAFVTFTKVSEAEKALEKLNKHPFQGALLSVTWGSK